MAYPFDLNEKHATEDDGRYENVKWMTYSHDVIENITNDNLTDSTSLITLQKFTEELEVRCNPSSGIDFWHRSERVLSIFRMSDFSV